MSAKREEPNLRSARAVCALLLSIAPLHARAQAEPSVLEIGDAPRLRAGEVGTVVVRVRMASAGAEPLLLTPSIQGQALQVVRGRLLREDASQRSASELRFEVPVVAREVGTALLRVELLTYRCQERCEAVRAEAGKLLQVVARGGP